MNQKEIKAVANQVIRSLQMSRKKREAEIPKVLLQRQHVQNCELLLNREELLGKMVKQSVVAEIGVDEGKFSRLIHKIVQPQKFHLIDMWGTDRFHDGKFEAVKSFFSDEIEQEQVQIHKKMSIEAAHDFADDYFDWIYIDTDHSYETTKDELNLYAPKVKQSGIIAGHDYVKGNWITTYRYGVIEAVHEFCVKNDWELIYLTAEPTESKSFAIRRVKENEK